MQPHTSMFRSVFAANLLVAWSAATAIAQDTAATPTDPTAITAEELTEMLNQGDDLLRQGNFPEALLTFQRAMQPADYATQSGVFDYFMRAHTGRGRALAGLQEYSDAIDELKQVLDQFENYAPALVARGEIYLELNVPSSALPDFQRAVKVAQTEEQAIDAYFGLGKASVLIGDFANGIKYLSRVISQGQNRHMAEAFRFRGIAQGNLDKFGLATADLEQSITLDPAAHETYFELGVLNLRKKDYQAAVDQFARAIENYTPPPGREDEPYSQGYLIKASAYIELGKETKDVAVRNRAYQSAVDEAQRLYSSVDEESRFTAPIRAAALVTRGIGERMLGQLGTAIRTFSQALELNPGAGEAYFRRGICLLAIGEDRMAIADFTQAAAINFEDPRNNLWEGFVYAKMGDYHEAIRAYGDAIAASDRFTPAYINRGLAYVKLGDYDKAISDFNNALRIEPTNGDYFFKRGVAYAQLGELQKAADSLASAIEFAPNHVAAYRYLGDVMQRLGRDELAEQYRQKASELEAAAAPQPPQT